MSGPGTNASEWLPVDVDPEGLLRSVLDESRDALLLSRLTGKILLFNPAAARLWSRNADAVIGRLGSSDLYPPDAWGELQRHLSRGNAGVPKRLGPVRTEILTGEGLRVPVELSASALGTTGAMVWSLRDLRTQVDLEERLARTERDLELGDRPALLAELGGTAAHELNQPLTSIMGHAALLRRRVPSEGPDAATLDIILREAERMADIVRKIGRVTRYETKPYVGESRIVDLDQAVAHEESGSE